MQQQPTCRPGDAGMRQDAGMASLLNRLERELHAAATARPRDAARYAGALEQAVQACQTNPAAAELFELTDLYLELTTAYEQLGHYDDALTTVDAVIAAGIKMQPDSRCLRAETLMRAGRVAEAEPIWTAVLADSPDDVWLYNNAGLEYADVGEHAVALHWLTEGLRLALRTGDPERPEDCGGPGGYAELLATLADPADPEHERMRTWVGNRLRPFDRAAVDQRVRQVVGAVPESVRLLLGFVADGVKLTPGGRLPRRIVRQMQQHRPQWYPLGRPASIEEDLWPLSELHDLLRRVGLLRLRHGVLSPTRAAGDDLAAGRAQVRRARAEPIADRGRHPLTKSSFLVSWCPHLKSPVSQLNPAHLGAERGRRSSADISRARTRRPAPAHPDHPVQCAKSCCRTRDSRAHWRCGCGLCWLTVPVIHSPGSAAQTAT